MALDIGLSVADSRFCLGDRKCQQGDVLYLALEDGDRRLQRRMTKFAADFWRRVASRSINGVKGILMHVS
jgi:hypothetical protein